MNPCLQGAFDTGVRAAKEVLESLKLQYVYTFYDVQRAALCDKEKQR